MAFLTEPVPERGVLLPVLPGVSRIVADNPGRMTYHGTNTYLLEADDGVTVLDPGPDQPEHVADILRLAPGPIVRILLTHTHRDHFGAVAALKAATGAPTHGWQRAATRASRPDVPIDDGDIVAGMEAVFTPGHAADHVCFARPDGALFSADHVMGWSSSVVSPPGGEHGRLLRQPAPAARTRRHDLSAWPRPGADRPAPLRRRRCCSTAWRGRRRSPPRLRDETDTTKALVDALYSKIDPVLKMAAERNVLSHLIKLEAEGKVTRRGEVWRAA